MTSQDRFLTELVSRSDFIGAMRSVASSVTVVTTDGSAGRLGATVSAFCSVSADPPSALVCLRAESRIALAVAENGAFCVNVLPQGCRVIAERFAGCHDKAVADRFEDVELTEILGALPAIAGATSFACALKERLAFGSHSICVGHVLEVQNGAPAPLTYLNGAYHQVVPHCEAAE